MNGKGLEHKVVLLGLELGSSQSYWKKNSKSHYYHLHNQLHWKYWFPAFQRNQPSLNLSRWSGVAKAARLQRLRSLGKQCPFLPKTMNIGQVFFFFFLASKCHQGLGHNSEQLSKSNHACGLRETGNDVCLGFACRWGERSLLLWRWLLDEFDILLSCWANFSSINSSCLTVIDCAYQWLSQARVLVRITWRLQRHKIQPGW